MLEEMLKDPAVRIQYSSKYAASTNSYKNSIGSNWAIKKRNFEQVKKEEQDKYKASRRKEMLKKIQKSKKIRMKQKGFFKKSINLIKL